MRDPSDKMVRAADLRVGDMVDLEGDKYADPSNGNSWLEFEYVLVASVTLETPNCVAVGFEGFDVVGFPPDHVLWRGEVRCFVEGGAA